MGKRPREEYIQEKEEALEEEEGYQPLQEIVGVAPDCRFQGSMVVLA